MWRRCLFSLFLMCAIHVASARGIDGYFLVFTFDGPNLGEPAIMALDTYQERRVRQPSGWSLRLLDAQGRELHRTALGDPFSHAGAEGLSLRQLVARVPAVSGSTTFELIDATESVVWRRAIDDHLRAKALAKARTARNVSSIGPKATDQPIDLLDNSAIRASNYRLARSARELLSRNGTTGQATNEPSKATQGEHRMFDPSVFLTTPGHLPEEDQSAHSPHPSVPQVDDQRLHPPSGLGITGPMQSPVPPATDGIRLNGRVLTESGVPPEASVEIELYVGDRHVQTTRTDPSGAFDFQGRPGTHYRFLVKPPAPFLPKWEALEIDDRILESGELPTMAIQAGVVVKIRPRGPSGESLMTSGQGGWVYVGYDYYGSFGFSSNANAWQIVVPTESEVTLNFRVNGTYFNPSIGPRRFSAEATVEPVFHPVRRLRGTIRRDDGSVHPQATVRAFDPSGYVTSTRSMPDGRYELLLKAGVYDIELDGRHHQSSVNLIYSKPVRFSSVPVTAAGVERDFTLTLPARGLTVNFIGNTQPRAPQITVRQDGKVQARTFAHGITGSCSPSLCEHSGKLLLDPGLYDVEIDVVNDQGRHLISYPAIDLRTSDHSVSIDAREQGARWRGRLLDASGEPVVNGYALALDQVALNRDFVFTDENGDFTIAAAPGWTIELGVPNEGLTIRERIQVDTLAGLPTNVRLDELSPPGFPDAQNVYPIFKGARAERARILFIGDGFTDVRETFTDTNGNGVWDGVLWHDFNGNGLLDRGEPFSVYGDAVEPIIGTTPGAENEPFLDLNGDGALSENDEAVFVLNAINHMRALLGSDYWEHHRDAFEARAAFTVSAQAGGDIINQQGNIVLQRRTFFGGGVELERNTLTMNRELAMMVAEQLWPGFDYLIILANQPVVFGRANTTIGSIPGSMLINGGVFGQFPSSQTMGHEAGHFFGLLADEYSEFSGNGDGWEPQESNVTTRTARSGIKWRNWLNPEQPLPSASVFPEAHIGLYEGAYYQQGGLYRPSWNSIMRGGHWFDKTHKTSLDNGLSRFTTLPPVLNQPGLTGNWYQPTTSGQGLTLQVHEDGSGSNAGLLFGGWFTFDIVSGDEDRQRWYILNGPIETGAHSAQLSIHANYGGNFDAPPPTQAQTLGRATFTAHDCNSATLEYAFDDGRYGSIPLKRLLNNVVCVPRGVQAPPGGPVYGLSGNWYEPETSGQGLMIELNPANRQLFATWFTYAPDGEGSDGAASQRWLAFQAPIGADFRTYTDFDVYLRKGGVFNDAQNSEVVGVGKGSLVFHSCTRATLTYDFHNGENAGRDGTIELHRLGEPMRGCMD